MRLPVLLRRPTALLGLLWQWREVTLSEINLISRFNFRSVATNVAWSVLLCVCLLVTTMSLNG